MTAGDKDSRRATVHFLEKSPGCGSGHGNRAVAGASPPAVARRNELARQLAEGQRARKILTDHREAERCWGRRGHVDFTSSCPCLWGRR